MGIARSANPWWLDVLENGPSSRFAHFFDIEWHPVKDELADKVLIPILGDQYGEVLERQELQLTYGDGAFVVRYYDDSLPIAPDTYAWILRPELEWAGWLSEHQAPWTRDELQSILTASRNLPSRSERDPEAIETRAREKEVIKRRLAALAGAQPRGRVAGRRERQPNQRRRRPAAQLRRARRAAERRSRTASRTGASRRRKSTTGASSTSTSLPRCAWRTRRSSRRCTASSSISSAAARRPACGSITSTASTPPAITCAGSRRRPRSAGRRHGRALRRRRKDSRHRASSCSTSWPVHGTTGYEFAGVVNSLFVDRRNERALDDIYRRFVRRAARTAVVRRSGLPQQEAGDARDDVGRHQLARPPAQSLLRAQPALPRLHALQPDLDAEGSDRVLPGLPHLRHRDRIRSAITIAATSSRRCRTRSAGRRAPPA